MELARLLALVTAIVLGGRAEALQLTAAVGGVNNVLNPYGSVYCDGDPSPVVVDGVISNSASCDGSTSSAQATDQLVLSASAYSTYGWQSAGRANYRETMSFDAAGLSGTNGTLLINIAITGARSLVNDDQPLDAEVELGALTQACLGCGAIDNINPDGYPLTLYEPATLPFLIHFEYGGPSLDLVVTLGPGTYGRYQETVASSEFAARIASYEFRDQDGQVVPNVEVTTQSGVNPFATVPEPSNAALLLAATTALATETWRRSA